MLILVLAMVGVAGWLVTDVALAALTARVLLVGGRLPGRIAVAVWVLIGVLGVFVMICVYVAVGRWLGSDRWLYVGWLLLWAASWLVRRLTGRQRESATRKSRLLSLAIVLAGLICFLLANESGRFHAWINGLVIRF